MNIRSYNREAWNREVATGNPWTIPVTPDEVARARCGDFALYLTPRRPVPRDWFPPLAGADVLGLASGGGQQGPVLAAAGARVTILDNSSRQLDRDRDVALRENLDVRCLEGDMCDLSGFADSSFDLVVHPVSNLFVPDVRPVWREAFRVLRAGGCLLSGFNNPAIYLFDLDAAEKGGLQVRHRLPYSDLESLPAGDLERFLAGGGPLEWSHTLDDLVGGQIDAGFAITGFYEDTDREAEERPHPLTQFMPVFLATRASKMTR